MCARYTHCHTCAASESRHRAPCCGLASASPGSTYKFPVSPRRHWGPQTPARPTESSPGPSPPKSVSQKDDSGLSHEGRGQEADQESPTLWTSERSRAASTGVFDGNGVSFLHPQRQRCAGHPCLLSLDEDGATQHSASSAHGVSPEAPTTTTLGPSCTPACPPPPPCRGPRSHQRGWEGPPCPACYPPPPRMSQGQPFLIQPTCRRRRQDGPLHKDRGSHTLFPAQGALAPGPRRSRPDLGGTGGAGWWMPGGLSKWTERSSHACTFQTGSDRIMGVGQQAVMRRELSRAEESLHGTRELASGPRT